MSSSAVLNKDEILKTLHVLTPELYAQYHVRKMGLFGSYATDSANEQSDIDILAEFEPGADIWDLSGLKMKLESIFNKKVDITTINAIKPDMKDSILTHVAYS